MSQTTRVARRGLELRAGCKQSPSFSAPAERGHPLVFRIITEVMTPGQKWGENGSTCPGVGDRGRRSRRLSPLVWRCLDSILKSYFMLWRNSHVNKLKYGSLISFYAWLLRWLFPFGLCPVLLGVIFMSLSNHLHLVLTQVIYKILYIICLWHAVGQ